MKYKKTKIFLILVTALSLTSVQAQVSTNAAGANAAGSGGSTTYSVGQVVYTTSTGTNGSVAQGVQQPYRISVETAVNEAADINLSFSAYPNPTTDLLILKIENHDMDNLSYQLCDINGKLLLDKKITSEETSIVMNDLAPQTYFLKIVQNKEVKTFKIIKK